MICESSRKASIIRKGTYSPLTRTQVFTAAVRLNPQLLLLKYQFGGLLVPRFHDFKMEVQWCFAKPVSSSHSGSLEFVRKTILPSGRKWCPSLATLEMPPKLFPIHFMGHVEVQGIVPSPASANLQSRSKSWTSRDGEVRRISVRRNYACPRHEFACVRFSQGSFELGFYYEIISSRLGPMNKCV